SFNLKNKFFLIVSALAAALFLPAIILAIKRMFYLNKEKLAFLLFILIIPIAILSAIWLLNIIPALIYARYLLYLSPIYYILIGYGLIEGLQNFSLSANSKKIFLVVALALIVFFNAVTLNYYYKLDSQQENWKHLVNDLNKNYKQSDLVFTDSPSQFYNLNYYFNQRASIYSLPQNTLLNNISLAEVYNSLEPVTENNSCNASKLANEKTKSAWLISFSSNYWGSSGLRLSLHKIIKYWMEKPRGYLFYN
ncbi:MAG: hypothetical protein HZB67_03235, partial [Candidatus Aenigmarchaeota archaeon]|nr:hypothetical protein [Candidatus Aenigmarchaeota archaeon]